MKITSISKKDISLFKRSFKYLAPYKAGLVIAFICILSGIGFNLVQPILWAKILMHLFNKEFEGLISIALFMLIFHILQMIVELIQNYQFSSLKEKIIYDIKQDVYSTILNLPVKAFDDIPAGEFMSRLNGDASTIASILTNQCLKTIVDILRVIILGIAVFQINAILALIVVLSFPLFFIVYSSFGIKLRKKNKEIVKVRDKYFSNIQESISGIREIKALGIKSRVLNTFANLSELFKKKTVDIEVLNAFTQALIRSIDFVFQLAVILTGFYLISTDILLIEPFIVFTTYSSQLSNSLIDLTQVNSTIQQALVSLERIFNVMDNFNYSREKYGTIKITNLKGNMKFQNVSFSYNENKSVLNNLTLEITENKKIAFVGSSGAGKSTIFNLLLRFYDTTSGDIFIDGINIKDFEEESLRNSISVVRQEPVLFNGTIKENLLLTNPSATNQEIIKACEAAYIHDFIQTLPGKYEHVIGENGINLSGGQKQRIAIARAILKKSEIVIFDEATSSLDNESQYKIKKAVDKLSENRTVLIIAHRLMTIIEADEIFVLHDGNISGKGPHEVLIKDNSEYKKLYERELNIFKNIL